MGKYTRTKCRFENRTKCKSHSEGKRCLEPGCTTSARPPTNKCITHGGGKRCIEPDCTSSARPPTDKCMRHGGGKRCNVPDCGKLVKPRSDKCKLHFEFLSENNPPHKTESIKLIKEETVTDYRTGIKGE